MDSLRVDRLRVPTAAGAALSGAVPSIVAAVSKVLRLHARGASTDQILAACQDLMSATERELVRRENGMMASGEPDLAAQVRRNGDILLKLEDEVRELRGESKQLSPRFLRFIRSLLETELRAVSRRSAALQA